MTKLTVNVIKIENGYAIVEHNGRRWVMRPEVVVPEVVVPEAVRQRPTIYATPSEIADWLKDNPDDAKLYKPNISPRKRRLIADILGGEIGEYLTKVEINGQWGRMGSEIPEAVLKAERGEPTVFPKLRQVRERPRVSLSADEALAALTGASSGRPQGS